jgi:hypothetical protein
MIFPVDGGRILGGRSPRLTLLPPGILGPSTLKVSTPKVSTVSPSA